MDCSHGRGPESQVIFPEFQLSVIFRDLGFCPHPLCPQRRLRVACHFHSPPLQMPLHQIAQRADPQRVLVERRDVVEGLAAGVKEVGFGFLRNFFQGFQAVSGRGRLFPGGIWAGRESS